MPRHQRPKGTPEMAEQRARTNATIHRGDDGHWYQLDDEGNPVRLTIVPRTTETPTEETT